MDSGCLLVHIRRSTADGTDQLGNPVGHVIEFRGQLTQFVAIAQHDVGGHIAGSDAASGFAETVNGGAHRHEEADVEIDHHQKNNNQGNDDQPALIDLTVQPRLQILVDHVESRRLDLIIVSQLPGHQVVVFSPGHFQAHWRNHVHIQLIPNHHQALINPLDGIARPLSQSRRCLRGQGQRW